MEGLYVAGEDAGGAHGSNRLGGNGVANSTVYGGVAGEIMGADVSKMKLRAPDEAILDAEIGCALYPTTKAAGHVQTLRNQLQEIMWDDVGVMRTSQGMTRGLDRLDTLENELMETGVDGTNLAFNLTWHDWLNMRSLLDISRAITIAGLKRENSRGAHFREDFPEEGDFETSQFTVTR